MQNRCVKCIALALLLVAGHCAAAVHFVTVVDIPTFAPNHMVPNEITIAVGDSVTFISRGLDRHNVHALDDSFRCSAGCRGDGSGASGDPALDWVVTVTFTHPGLVKYGCDRHPWTLTTDPAIIHVVAAGAEFDPNQAGITGTWANPTTDSQGFVVDVVPDFYGSGGALLFGGWFTYDTSAAGGRRWYTVQGQLGPSSSSTMGIYQTLGGSLDSSQATHINAVGTTTIGFVDCNHGVLDYTFNDGRSGSIPLTRLLPNVTCTAGNTGGTTGQDATRSAWSGTWADVGNSGQGLVIEFNPVQSYMFGAWYTFAANAAANGGASAQDWFTLQALAPAGANALHDIGIYAASGGVFDQHANTTTTQVGSADLTMHSCTSATLTYDFTGGANAGHSGTLELSRITPASADCRLWP